MDNPIIGTLLCPPTASPSAVTFPSTSDDDDPHHSAASGGGGDPSAAKKPSPWHRMKWTDDIVRLLISLVSYVGDDASPPDSSAKKLPGGAALQKKGKWKTVSKLMLDQGCYVSPQQCEDKFNDLNKRYKRLNEILGRGTTCQVVENPSLLDSMHHVPAKAKEDVRKILSSKHLFYREMCAYHNGQRIPSSRELELKANGGVEEEEQDLNLKDSDESEEDEEEEDGFGKAAGIEGFGIEIDGFTAGQKSEWLRKRRLQLMEERVKIEMEGFELAKRRAKWERFKSKKDWEMDRARVENKRLMLENERMLLQMRQKEVESDEHGRAQRESTRCQGCNCDQALEVKGAGMGDGKSRVQDHWKEIYRSKLDIGSITLVRAGL